MRDRATIEASHGRWREILPALGVPDALLTARQQPCPFCGGKDRFQFSDRNGEGDFICRQCGAGKGVQLLMKLHGWDYRRAFDEVDSVIGNLPPPQPAMNGKRVFVNTDELNLIWRAAQPISHGDAVWCYLAKRGIGIEGRDLRSLRLTVLPHHPTGTVHPVMVACMSDSSGKPRQIHRTYLTRHGDKANVEPVRMFMPCKLPIGGAIRLGDAAETMGIAEGIETALSASILYGIPVWATTSDQMLVQWQAPPMAKHVVIFGDSDASYAGQAAGFALAKRLVHEDKEVSVMLAPMGQDFNDVLRGKK